MAAFVVAAIAILVAMGFIYHLGWEHGWERGVVAGQASVDLRLEDDQPAVKNPFYLLYALGWHHGWDYGFRSGTRMREEEPKR